MTREILINLLNLSSSVAILSEEWLSTSPKAKIKLYSYALHC